MSDSVQRLVLLFGTAMVVMIALLLLLQIGVGSLVDGEPHMINGQSLAFCMLFSAGVTFAFGNRGG